jgi:hypothetical protein
MIRLWPQDGPITEAGDDKGNPYHDRSGRFSTKGGAGGVSRSSGSSATGSSAAPASASLASDENIARISKRLAGLPSGSQLVIGSDVFETSGDSWSSLSGASDPVSHDDMAATQVPLLVSRGLLPGAVAITPNQQAQIGVLLMKEAEKAAVNTPLLVFSLAAASDWTSTAWVLSHPLAHEDNPMISWAKNPAAIIGLGAGMDAVGAYAWMKVTKNHPKLQATGFYVAAAFRGYLVIHNIVLNRTAHTGIPNP